MPITTTGSSSASSTSVSVSVSVSVYFHHIYHTNEQYKENIGGENQKEQSSKWMVTQSYKILMTTNLKNYNITTTNKGQDIVSAQQDRTGHVQVYI